MTLSDGSNSVVVTDGGGNDANGASDIITYIGSVGCFTMNVSTGAGDAWLPTVYGIDLNSFNTAMCPGSTTLTITLSQDGFVGGSYFVGSIGGTLSGLDIAYAMYVDGANTLGGTASYVGGGQQTANGAFADSFAGSLGEFSGPYSMTLVVGLTGQYGSGSFDFEGAVPEPGSLALIGLGLAGLGFAARRRHRQ